MLQKRLFRVDFSGLLLLVAISVDCLIFLPPSFSAAILRRSNNGWTYYLSILFVIKCQHIISLYIDTCTSTSFSAEFSGRILISFRICFCLPPFSCNCMSWRDSSFLHAVNPNCKKGERAIKTKYNEKCQSRIIGKN